MIVVSKAGGKFKELATIGVASGEEEVRRLSAEAEKWIQERMGQTEMALSSGMEDEAEETERVLSKVEAVMLNGTQLLLGRIYDSIGFGAIPDSELKQLVVARVSCPMSKRATVDYLKSHYGEDYDLNAVYRYMDKLYNTQMEVVRRISVGHTRRVLGGVIGLVFYDVTTLYFETGETDSLREPGYSKDGKNKESQVVLGLLVSERGYPLSYSLYNGRQYEGFTMIPMIDDFRHRYGIGDDIVIVADSGLMNKRNVRLLDEAGYRYIIGARIKSESPMVREWILSRHLKDSETAECVRPDGNRLVLGYSSERARKDAYNRERGVERLRKAYSSGRLTKENVNKRGYNKFLDIGKDIAVSLNEAKIVEDAEWDGLKGYITNTGLPAADVIRQYHGLWVVERAFRVTKGNIAARPIFHFTEKRIEAHICVCFMAYKVYKELERVVMSMRLGISVDSVIRIAKTITTIRVSMRGNTAAYTKTLFLTEEHRSIKPLFECDLSQF